MQKIFTKDFIERNVEFSYYNSQNEYCEYSFMHQGRDVVTIEELINSELALESKILFVIKKTSLIPYQKKSLVIGIVEIVLGVFEEKFPSNKTPREAIQAARDYINRKIGVELVREKRLAMTAVIDTARDVSDALSIATTNFDGNTDYSSYAAYDAHNSDATVYVNADAYYAAREARDTAYKTAHAVYSAISAVGAAVDYIIAFVRLDVATARYEASVAEANAIDYYTRAASRAAYYLAIAANPDDTASALYSAYHAGRDARTSYKPFITFQSEEDDSELDYAAKDVADCLVNLVGDVISACDSSPKFRALLINYLKQVVELFQMSSDTNSVPAVEPPLM